MVNKKLFEYVDYDKISDDIYFLGGGARLILRMNVCLAKKGTDDSRNHFYHEYAYDSKYHDVGRVISMRRSYDYYLSLESLENKMSSVMIRPQDMYILRSKLNEAISWFNNGTFMFKDNKLYVLEGGQYISISGFADNKYISLSPVVIDYNDKGYKGIRISLSELVYSDIFIDRMYGLLYIINSFNMFQSAQSMLAFMGRPDIGTNRIEFDNAYNDYYEQEVPEGQVKNRKLPVKGQSYFDKIDGLT